MRSKFALIICGRITKTLLGIVFCVEFRKVVF